MDAVPELPRRSTLAWPTLLTIRDLGGSASIEEINAGVVDLCDITEEQQQIPHGGDTRSELAYRLAWTRTMLKNLGLIANSERGVWATTEHGDVVSEAELGALERSRGDQSDPTVKSNAAAGPGLDAEDVDPALSSSADAAQAEIDHDNAWRNELLSLVKQMDPYGFERLCQRLLREAGFVNVTVTKKSGDGGIDGVGVYRLSLLSFPVYFQAKRFKDSVSSPTVRDFRGAMSGRGDKGLLITTGTFTSDARSEATRDGAPPIELIDGDRLADLIREYGLGVAEHPRVDITVDADYFSTV